MRGVGERRVNYAVSDIVCRDVGGIPVNCCRVSYKPAVSRRGDLVYNKSVAFAWPDWQQGGKQGGMAGDKQNPTIWLAHLRCTDRHRVGDNTRAMFLGRWGGLGGHRYQVRRVQHNGQLPLPSARSAPLSLLPGRLLWRRAPAYVALARLPAVLLSDCRCGLPAHVT